MFHIESPWEVLEGRTIPSLQACLTILSLLFIYIGTAKLRTTRRVSVKPLVRDLDRQGK